MRRIHSFILIALFSLTVALSTESESRAQDYVPGAVDLLAPADQQQLGDAIESDGILQDNQVQPAGYSDWNNVSAYCAPSLNQCPNVPWILGPYFRAGVVHNLGDGIFDGQHETGYTLSGGVRQPTPFGMLGDNSFLDLGGSYLSAFGQTTRAAPGLIDNPLDSNPATVAADALTSTLTELRRSGVHAAIGWHWGASPDNQSLDPQLGWTLTLGGRWNHMHGRFIDVPDPANIPAGFNLLGRAYSTTDTNGGLFAGIEAILLQRTSSFGLMQLTVDGEFGHDWVQFGGFDSGGLGVAAVQFGFMLSR